MEGNTVVTLAFYFAVPARIEIDAFNRLHDVDAVWRHTQMEERLAVNEVLDGNMTDGCTVVHRFTVLLVGLYPDIKVVGSARLVVETDGISANHQVLNPVLVEDGQQVLKVFVQLHA